MKQALLESLLAAEAERRRAVLVTDIRTGLQCLLGDDAVQSDLRLDEATRVQLDQLVQGDRSGLVETPSGTLFVEIRNPSLRLAIVGAVHIAQALAPAAALAGFEVTVIDPRRAFAAEHRFPGLTVTTDWPDEALEAFGPDVRTAIVTLTHDPKIDDPALQAALRSSAFYIGALGSRRTHARRLERLSAAGFDAEAGARIRGPVGLDIGALTAGEIAISIMAQIIATLRADRVAARRQA